MGYRTPNIDRVADEGMRFSDSYREQSCTAGRAAFITGQSVYRTGLSKVGIPGAARSSSAPPSRSSPTSWRRSRSSRPSEGGGSGRRTGTPTGTPSTSIRRAVPRPPVDPR